ncbi:hypothetical protein DFA_09726 [Cavenderia fasciculata]|uniref:Uncharacterized protein n=1 Tax=Cavenderia fasciculata TaxID=261658 RepID=F4Q8F4_CACFS|nr:uncharacterized protein DFA_09726 [Cavenderia fasciculata]EGG16054.1 hypothetical protein DFA_09726 [Cavenderia fasciculata]|eukprot:XP_004352379.1 hypothetical protein DFA_09726 [Cavenderia fasciculata]
MSNLYQVKKEEIRVIFNYLIGDIEGQLDCDVTKFFFKNEIIICTTKPSPNTAIFNYEVTVDVIFDTRVAFPSNKISFSYFRKL